MKFIQLIFFLFILVLIFLNNDTIPYNIRKLFKSEIKSYVCNKADSDLMNKYKNGFYEEVINKKEGLNKAQKGLVDFIKNSSYKNIKPYLKRIGVYIAFFVLDIIFIILWILLGISCHKKIFIFKKSKLTKFKFIIFSSIVLLFNILVIIFSIIILVINESFFEKINGMSCSFMIFFDHINYGLSPSYPTEARHWLGFIGIIEKFRIDENKFHTIDHAKINAAYNDVSNLSPENCGSTFAITKIDEDKTEFEEFTDDVYGNI